MEPEVRSTHLSIFTMCALNVIQIDDVVIILIIFEKVAYQTFVEYRVTTMDHHRKEQNSENLYIVQKLIEATYLKYFQDPHFQIIPKVSLACLF